MDIDTFNRLKQTVDARQREYDRELGAYRQTIRQLKEEFKCKSLDHARSLLAKKQKELKSTESKFARRLKRFLRKHKDVLR